ncbi:MAG: LysR family transcriptional regulator [Proteobacteria bacterium]|nr:MAG: LysR family transcriptional regulator [Pseudomonadota bacterium]
MLTDIAHHSEKFHYFYRIAKLQSLHAAARELKIAVPSLSHAVKTLETAAGAPLFFRSHSGVTLTNHSILMKRYRYPLQQIEVRLF